MARGKGSNSKLRIKFESTYGTQPTGNWDEVPFASFNHGASQGLIASDLLGQGRDPATPSQDVVDVSGTIVVPVDYRNIGQWLKALFGAPTSTNEKATGSFTFTSQPAANATITLNGVTWTFVSGAPSGNQTQIQGSLSATLTQLATDLNASVNAEIAKLTYTATATALNMSHDVAGATGNTYTLAASTSPNSNATASGATLTGGGYQHLFTSGAASLLSFAAELAIPDADDASFFVTLGNMLNSMALNFQRSGHAQATLNLIGQGETRFTATQAGTPTVATFTRFSQFQGQIKKAGTAVADVTGAELTYSNNLDAVPAIRSDGKIDGIDEGVGSCVGRIVARFRDVDALLVPAEQGTSVDLEFGYFKTAHEKLTFTLPEVYLPRPKREVSGPTGISATYDWQGAKNNAAGYMLRVNLRNDVASY